MKGKEGKGKSLKEPTGSQHQNGHFTLECVNSKLSILHRIAIWFILNSEAAKPILG